jgi:hypothetical protein
VRHQQLHHRNPVIVHRSAHQRPVAALMNVAAVRDHPARHVEPGLAGRSLHTAAFRHPRQRAVLVVAQRRFVQCRILRHHCDHARQVLRVDGLLELPAFLQQFDVDLQLRPTVKTIIARDLELRVGQ